MNDLATEISHLSEELAAIERAGPSFDEKWAVVEADLAKAEATYRRIGLCLSGRLNMAPEAVEERRWAEAGRHLVDVAQRRAIVESERKRITEETRSGISQVDKVRRIEQLRAAILRAAARRELALRAIETAGEFQPRPVHPELLVYRQAQVEQLAQ